jgi:hypothetical protein
MKRDGCPLVGSESKRPKIDPAAELRSLAQQFQMCTIAVARVDNNQPATWQCLGRILPIWQEDDIMKLMTSQELHTCISAMDLYIRRKGG